MGHTTTPIAAKRLLERHELRAQHGLDARAGLVAGPQRIAKRLDDVVGCDAQVRCTLLDHFQHALEDSGDCAERSVLALVEAAQSVEMTEQLVRPVDQVHDHAGAPRV